jgi:hypothetical protein
LGEKKRTFCEKVRIEKEQICAVKFNLNDQNHMEEVLVDHNRHMVEH